MKSLLLIIEIPTNWLFQITYEFQKLFNFVKGMKLSSPNDYDKTNAKSKGEDNEYKEEPLATIFICCIFPVTTSLDRIGHVFLTLIFYLWHQFTNLFSPIHDYFLQNMVLFVILMTNLFVSMTTLLTHTVAHSTKPSFMPKTNNQPPKKFLSLALSWAKLVKNWTSF